MKSVFNFILLMKEKIVWWIVGFIIYSIISLILVVFMFSFTILVSGGWIAEIWEAFNKTSFLEWAFTSQIIMISLIITAGVHRAKKFLVKIWV